MFLITTADQRFWKTDEPVLFLGEWCKIFSERHIWEKLDYEVLPYHWDDRERLYKDYLYLNQLYEDILVQLSNCLNKIHGEKYSTRYWRIIVGPWLYFFIEICYDRYLSILTSELSGKVTNTFIAKHEAGIWTPIDFDGFNKYFILDAYNNYLYSRIIEMISGLPYEIKDNLKDQLIKTEPNINSREVFSSIKSILKRIVNMSWKLIPSSLNKMVFVTSYFSLCKQIKLQIALRQIPYLYFPNFDTPKTEINFEKRKEIYIDPSKNKFISLLGRLIPEQIPTCYIESYTFMKNKVAKKYPSKPKMIFTANASFENEEFKFWAASNIENGTILLGTQHGGLYGMGLWTANEDHEYNIYDRYYTWGWEDTSRGKIKPLPATKLSAVKKKAPDKNGRILLVHMGMSRYAYSLLSMPISTPGYNRYLSGIFSFIKHLGKEPQKLLLVRLFQEDYGFCLKEQFTYKYPGIECYRGRDSMFDQMKKSRLFVGTYNATTYLEAFSANFPTVLFWDPTQWEIRASAQPYFDELRRVGILHDTPESAANLVNKTYNDFTSWWHRPEIQKAKDQFCYKFARRSEHWLREWKEEFLDLELNFRVKNG